MNKLDEMTNLEIKENIISINREQLKNIRQASYLNVFHSILGVKELLYNERVLDEFKFTKEYSLLQQHLTDSINCVKKFINQRDERKHTKEFDNLKLKREELYEIYSILEGYSIAISYVGELINEYGIKFLYNKQYDNMVYDGKKTEGLINRIDQILNNNRDNYEMYIYIISEIISILPMRLVKENYNRIIKDTLKRNLSIQNKSQVTIQIDDYKKRFDSSSRDGYGIQFDYYFTEIQKLKNIQLKNKNLDELDKFQEASVKLTKEIYKTVNLVLMLGLITNMNIVISLIYTDEIDEQIIKLYGQWIGLLENHDDKRLKQFISIIEKEIKEIEKSIFKDLDVFQALNMEAVDRKDFNFDKLDEDLLFTQKVLTFYNDSEFVNYKVIFPEDREKPSTEYLDELIDSLIQYINRSEKNMNNLERRVRMRRLLSLIELPFDGIGGFLDYIRYSLDNRIVDKKEINFKIDHIHHFLDAITQQENK